MSPETDPKSATSETEQNPVEVFKQNAAVTEAPQPEVQPGKPGWQHNCDGRSW